MPLHRLLYSPQFFTVMLILSPLVYCSDSHAISSSELPTQPTPEPTSPPTTNASGNQWSIGFGSCLHQGVPAPTLLAAAEAKPDLWIWLGDNIYHDIGASGSTCKPGECGSDPFTEAWQGAFVKLHKMLYNIEYTHEWAKVNCGRQVAFPNCLLKLRPQIPPLDPPTPIPCAARRRT